jgi:hypothetical protein
VNGWKVRIPLAFLVVGLGAGYGYYAEQRLMEGAGSRPASLRSVVRHVLASAPAAAARERLDGLRNRAGHTDLSPRERAECWEIIRGFTVEQVKDYLAELPDPPRDRPANFLLGMMLYYRWAEIDPEAAASAAGKDRLYSGSIMTAWMSRDPAAAIRWAAANQDDVGFMAGRLFAMEDPHTAIDRADAVGQRALRSTLSTLAQQMSGSEESRKEFFKLAEGKAGTKEWDSALSSMVTSCMDRDPMDTLNHVDQFGLPADQTDRLRGEMIKQLVRNSPERALTWMQQPDAAVPVDEQRTIYSQWARDHPDEASAWAVKNERPELLAEAVQAAAKIVLQNDGDHWQNGLKTQFNAWQQRQPDAAQAWLATMPARVRENLTPTADVTH